MSNLRTAAQQALEACEQRLPLKGQAAIIDELNNLRAALAQQAEPTVTEDMKSAVRWAPSSAYWSERLREFFGPDAREGIDALERRLAKAQQAEPVQDQRLCRAEPRSDGDFVCDCKKIGGCPGRSAEPAQEPVAYIHRQGNHWEVSERHLDSDEKSRGWTEEPLYTAPPQRKQAEPAQEPITRLFGTLPVHDTQQAPPQQAEPVAHNIADEMLKMLEEVSLTDPVFADRVICKIDAALPAFRAALAQRDQPQGCATEEECTYQPWCRICGTCQRKQAEPVQPFGYWFSDKHQDAVCSGWFVRSPCDGKLDGKPGVPLYTAPPQRKPLTAQQLDGVIERHVGGSEITDAMYTSMEQFARAVEQASWEKNHG